MKNCEYFEDLLCRLPDGDLTAEESAELLAHVDTCPDCARLYAAFSSMTGAIRSAQAEPPAALAEGVMDRIWEAAAQAAPVKKIPRFRPWFAQLAAACFVLVVAAAAVTGVFSARRDSADETAMVRAADTPQTASAEITAAPAVENSVPAEPAVPDMAQAPAVPDGAAAETAPEPPAEDTAPALEEPAAPAEMAASGMAPEVPAPASEEAEGDEDAGIMLAMEPPAEDALSAALTVYDAAGEPVGAIADADALMALLTGETVEGDLPEPVYTVTADGQDLCFAADEAGGLLWWRTGDSAPTRSAAALADLQALIQ